MSRPRVRALIAGGVAVLMLAAGIVIAGYANADSAPRRIVNGWLPYWSMTSSLNSVTANADLWGEASPFWYQATGATTITGHTGAGSATVIDALRSRGIKVVPTVTETLNGTAMAALLADPAQRAAHVQALVNLVTANGYDGVDLDYESMNFGGTATDKATVRTGFVTLVRELGSALDVQGKLLSVTVGSRTSATDPNWYVFDYAGLAPSSDRFRIMAYDYHWSGGPPGPVAPLWWVENVLRYAVTAVPPSKIELGVPLYGYDWPANSSQPDGFGNASSRTFVQAEALRTQYGATRQWSSADAAPYFTYTAAGVNRVVWYNDAESTKAKMALIPKYGLGDLAFWAVGAEDTRQWPALRSFAIQRTNALSVAAPVAVVYGGRATVSGRLTTPSGTAVPGQKVVLQWRATGTTTWSTVATGITSTTGSVSLGYVPGRNGVFRLYAPATWQYLAAFSALANTYVRWRVTAGFDDATVTRGTTVRLRGTVAPIAAGTTVRRQRYVNGAWSTVGTTTVRSDGTYLFSLTWNTAGTYTYRVMVPATTLYYNGYSATLKLYVS